MAFATKYITYFSDRDEGKFKAIIMVDGFVGTPIELESSGQACIIEYEESDNKFNPVNGSGCSLRFYNNGTVKAEDLFSIEPFEKILEIHQYAIELDDYVRIWAGYINTEVFDEDYTWSEGEIVVTANDSLSAIKREKYFTGPYIYTDGLVKTPWALGVKTVRNVLANCLAKGLFYRIYTIVDTQGQVSNFDNMTVDLSNYVDEDAESMSKRDVLESILEPLTLRCYIFGNACWIIDPTVLASASSTVSYKAYSKYFIAVPSEDSSFTKDFDITTGDMRFIDSSQRVSLVGGFQTMISNYSAYPDVKKIIPYNPSAIQLTDAAIAAGFTHNDYMFVEGGFSHRTLTTQDYSKYGLTVNGINSGLTEYARSDSDSDYGVMETELDNGNQSGDNCFFIRNSIFDTDNDVTNSEQDAIIINGGYIPKSDDLINVRFKLRIDSVRKSDAKINIIDQFMRVKIGNNYGHLSNGIVSNFASTPHKFILSADARIQLESKNAWTDFLQFEFSIKNDVGGGLLKIIFNRKTMLWVILDRLYEIGLTGVGTVFIKDFEVYINKTEINEDDLEYKTESGVNFSQSHTIDINNSSRRINGCLDRGSFINSNGEHETYFSRTSYPQLGSIGLTMAKAYLENYYRPYRKMSATIQYDGDFLRNVSGIYSEPTIPLNITGVWTPMNILMDVAHLGSKRFIFSGGIIDLIDKTVSGTWDEVMNANYIITDES